MSNQDDEQTTKMAETIRKAAYKIMERAPEWTNDDPTLAVGAIALAAATTASWIGLSKKELLELLDAYYDTAVKHDVQSELAKDGIPMAKPSGEPN